MSKKDYFLIISRRMMDKIDKMYEVDRNMSAYIAEHRHLLEQCSQILDDRTEELDEANCIIHDLKRQIKELEKMTTSIW